MNIDKLLKDAISEVNNVNTDDGEFLVKELFKGYEWKRISKADRMRLGTLFLYSVQSGNIEGVETTRKTSSNQQKYKKI
jgi:hypothetical protein